MSPPSGLPPESAAARHLIVVIGDGMSVASERVASRYLTGTESGLSFHDFPVQGFVSTWDVTTYDRYAWELGRPAFQAADFDPRLGYDVARGGHLPSVGSTDRDPGYFLNRIAGWGGAPPNIPATDSAAAATAMATGVKTDVGKIACAPGGRQAPLETIAETLRARKGAALGLVTTVPFAHATSAAFFAHNLQRSNYFDIAGEILARTRPEVVVGGGHPGWQAGFIAPADYSGLVDGSAGYTLVERRPGGDGGTELLAAARALPAAGRLFGLFGGIRGHFEPPVPSADGSAAVPLATRENPTLAQAAEAALLVLGRDPDGFFLLIEQGDIDWANHAKDYAWMVGGLYDLGRAVATVVAFIDRPGDALDWTNTLLIVTSDHAVGFPRLPGKVALGKGRLPPQKNAAGNPAHTNELVAFYARGQGAERLSEMAGTWYPGTRIIDNTQIYRALRASAGIDP